MALFQTYVHVDADHAGGISVSLRVRFGIIYGVGGWLVAHARASKQFRRRNRILGHEEMDGWTAGLFWWKFLGVEVTSISSL